MCENLLRERIQVVFTSMDLDRLEEGFRRFPPYRAIVCYNKLPKAIHRVQVIEVEKSMVELLMKQGLLNSDEGNYYASQIEKREQAIISGSLKDSVIDFETERVRWLPLSFYSFEEALYELFSLFYREQKQNREIVVNISGGTRPVAFAACYASALVDNCVPIYFLAKKWIPSETEGGIAKGVIYSEGPIYVNIDLKSILPTESLEIYALLAFLEKNFVRSVNELQSLIKSYVKDGKRGIGSCRYVIANFKEKGFINVTNGLYSLTPSGRMIARIVKERAKIDGMLRP